MDTVWIVLLCAACLAAGWLLAALRTGRKYAGRLARERKQTERVAYHLRMYDNWMMAKKYGRPMEEYLLERGIRRVVIYGAVEFGVRLYHELKDTPVEVLYALDRDPKYKIPGLPIYTWGDEAAPPPEAAKRAADAVIVAVYLHCDTVAPELTNAGYKNIIGLDELIYDLI